MRTYIKILLLFLLTLGVTIGANAQKFKKKYRYWSVGGSVSAMNYMGELDPGPTRFNASIKYTRPNFGVCLVHRFAPRLSWRGNLFYGRIRGNDYESSDVGGNDLGRKHRNMNFRNNLIELKFDVIIDFFANRRGLDRRVDYTPYAFIGIAGFYHNPKGYNPNADEWVALRPLGTEGQNIGITPKYNLLQVAVPMGLGFRYNLGGFWDLAFEIGLRVTFTDYLDDVGREKYVDKYKLGNPDDLAVLMSDPSVFLIGKDDFVDANKYYVTHEGKQYTYVGGYGDEANIRANTRKDFYVVSGFHLTYIFHPRVICPKYRG